MKFATQILPLLNLVGINIFTFQLTRRVEEKFPQYNSAFWSNSALWSRPCEEYSVTTVKVMD